MHRTDSDLQSALRQLPSVDRLLRLSTRCERPQPLLARAARELVADLRAGIAGGALDADAVAARCTDAALAAALDQRCDQLELRRHRRVYNATGIVLHTGLGRAPLAAAAIAALCDAAGNAVVEVDPRSGERDQREVAVGELLAGLTGATAALVVNNNAAAVTLALAALCAGREVVISRGELVEIGGGFRLPEVMQRSGAVMVEVGTTNRTHLNDFETATEAGTVAYLKVHPSNFRIEGFAASPALADLAALARRRGLLLIHDQGSGLLWRGPLPGLDDEPRVADSVAAGAHVTCGSGDKLLGGPQCGVLVGDRELIARCRAHPLYRALRCDKLALAALEATLRIYRDGDPRREIPALRMLTADPAELRQRSEELCAQLGDRGAEIVASESFAGSGANPARPLPSYAVALPGGEPLHARLRATQPIGVFARVADGRVLLDARSLLLDDLGAVAAAVSAALAAGPLPS